MVLALLAQPLPVIVSLMGGMGTFYLKHYGLIDAMN